MTEQNRPADGTPDGAGRADDAAWSRPHVDPAAQQPSSGTGQPHPGDAATDRFGAPQPGGYGQPGQHPTQQFPGQQAPGPHGAQAYSPQPQPQPPHQGWPPAGWSGAGQAPGAQPGGPAFGQPYGQAYGQTGQVPPAFQAPEPARTGGRWKIGVAGLVAGAVIGGLVGGGVAALTDHGTVTTASSAPAQNVTIKDPENATTATAAAAKAAPSVVTIYVTGSSASGSGSGVVLSRDGYVLTNNHVVTLDSSTDQAGIQVRTTDGALYTATVVGTDPTSDLAVIKLADASSLTPATFADSDKVQVGDTSVAIGAPLGLSNTVTDGIISATNRAVQTGSTQDDSTVIDAIQTDAAINPGNSGGPLVDSAGEVIGINSAIAAVTSSSSSDAQSGNIGVGFAIPSDTAKRIADQIVKTGKATHALLGVSAQTASDGANSEVGTGAQLASVQGGSPAGDAGLKAGDVITAVGDRQVTSSTELTAAIRSEDPGDKVTLTIRRGSDTSKVDVTLDESD